MSNAEDDLYSPAREYAQSLVQIGTVGWERREEHTDLGTVDNDGLTFVCVTLYAGKTPGEAVTKGVAQGHEILCHLADGIFRIPKKGAKCWVVIPAGMEQLDGAGLIVGTASPGSEIRRNVKPGDTFIGATGGGEAGIVIKADGSVVIFTRDDNTPTGKLVAWKLAPTGQTFSAPIGSYAHDATGWHVKTKAGPRIDMGGMALPGVPSSITDLLGTYMTFTGGKIKVGGAIVKLGVGPTYGTALQAPASALAPVPGPQPVLTGATSQSCSVLVTTP